MNLTVCIATFNGVKYLDEQICSVLDNLRDGDEIIILDDCSNDGTWDLICNYTDPRIKVYKNDKNLGHVRTFGKLLELSTHEIVVLCDQDDIWSQGRLELMRSALCGSHACLVTGNLQSIDSGGQRLNCLKTEINVNDSGKNLLNIIRIIVGNSPYFGCVMALRRELIKKVLPIPSYIESHDLWIALCANVIQRNMHIEQIVLYRRIHGANASLSGRPFVNKVISRILLTFACLHFVLRLLQRKTASF